jgi:hypothetical protein
LIVDSSDGGGRRVDEGTLRYLARLLGKQSEVRGTSLFPAGKQETLVVSFDTSYYPEGVEKADIEVRIYSNGDFHVSYIEIYLGETRRCRWDRHDQGHNSRDHFHPLPTASTDDAEDREFPETIFETLQRVILPWIQNRLGDLWEE